LGHNLDQTQLGFTKPNTKEILTRMNLFLRKWYILGTHLSTLTVGMVPLKAYALHLKYFAWATRRSKNSLQIGIYWRILKGAWRSWRYWWILF